MIHCSFCGKEDKAVAKVIAGPGVHICDECVALCNTILGSASPGDPPPRMPMWDGMTDDEILARIPRIARVAGQVEDNLRDWVTELRRRAVTWERIGIALGMTRQSAWGRFSGEQ